MDMTLIETVGEKALRATIHQHKDGWYSVRYYCYGGQDVGNIEVPASVRRFPASCLADARASAEKFARCGSTH